MEETTSFSLFHNTTVNSTYTQTSGSTTVQADFSSGYEPWVVAVAAGIPSILALILAVVLVVVCVLQWKNCLWKQTHGRSSGWEEHSYESYPPRSPDDFYMTMMHGTTNTYVNEGQDKHRKLNIQTQAQPVRTNKPRREPPVVDSIYENHPRCH